MAINNEAAQLLADNLRRELAARGWTQLDFAAKLGMAQPQVSRILRAVDEIKIGTLLRVARVLSVPVSDLLPSSEEVSASA